MSGNRRGRKRETGAPANGKTTAKSTVVGVLIPQLHGGALRNGGTNKGGTGRPKNVLRDAMRDRLEVLLPRLDTLLESSQLDPLRYADFLAKYGLGTQREDDVTMREVTFTPAERGERVRELFARAEQRRKRA